MAQENGSELGDIARVLRERRTVHEFKADIPPLATLEQAVDLARWAPNHHRTEPWHFYLLDSATGMRIADLSAEIVLRNKGEKVAAVKRRRWREMPGWLVVTCARSEDPIRAREDYAACCCAVHNIALYLWEQGIGMKWTTGKVTREQAFFDLLNIDFETQTVIGLFWYGYPQTIPVQHRKPKSSVLTHVVSGDDSA